MKKKFRKDELENIAKIYKCLFDSKSWIWIREIARRTKLNHKTVSRLINRYFMDFIEETTLPPFRIRLIRLKKRVDFNTFIKFIEMKKKFEEII